MTIIVCGYIIGYPLGGMTWHHLNYLAGLHEMGHDVWFYEDSGQWYVPYNPVTNTCEPDPAYGIDYLKAAMASVGMPVQFCYHSELLNRYYGMDREDWLKLVNRADVLIAVSGVTPFRDEFAKAGRTVVIDTDPVFTQLRMQHDSEFKDYYRCFDRVASFGRLIGTAGCKLPTHGFDWIPTNQPISLRQWPASSTTSRTFSTIGKWDHGPGRKLEFEGHTYESSKGVEWMKLKELPSQSLFTLEMAMASMPMEMMGAFGSHGWAFTDPTVASISVSSFAEYIRSNAGELTVVKQIYSGLPSGWFSDRSACFLASGRPVITQSSGFELWLPTGNGLFVFSTLEGAAESLSIIASDYSHHARAAEKIAKQYFDSRKVLSDLITRIQN